MLLPIAFATVAAWGGKKHHPRWVGFYETSLNAIQRMAETGPPGLLGFDQVMEKKRRGILKDLLCDLPAVERRSGIETIFEFTESDAGEGSILVNNVLSISYRVTARILVLSERGSSRAPLAVGSIVLKIFEDSKSLASLEITPGDFEFDSGQGETRLRLSASGRAGVWSRIGNARRYRDRLNSVLVLRSIGPGRPAWFELPLDHRSTRYLLGVGRGMGLRALIERCRRTLSPLTMP